MPSHQERRTPLPPDFVYQPPCRHPAFTTDRERRTFLCTQCGADVRRIADGRSLREQVIEEHQRILAADIGVIPSVYGPL